MDITAPRVSVVIPAHNASETLLTAVESVLGQTFSDLEVLIIDDGSTDETYSVALSVTDARVHVIQQENRGAPSARNAGIKAATGHQVAFLDADDLWYPDKLERQLEFMDRVGAGATQTAVQFVSNDLVPLHRGPCPPFADSVLDVLLFRNLPGLMSTLVVERNLLRQVGLFDESLEILEDWEMAIRLARQGSLQNLDVSLTMYRLHPDNRSRNLQIHIAPGFQVLENLFADSQLPDRIRRQRARIYAALFAMYSGGALRSAHYAESLKWGFRAVRTHPSALGPIVGLPLRKMRRRLSGFSPDRPRRERGT